MANSGRDYGSIIMFRELLIRRVDLTLLSDPIAVDGGCGIVRDDHSRDAADVLQHADVGLDPAGLLHDIPAGSRKTSGKRIQHPAAQSLGYGSARLRR